MSCAECRHWRTAKVPIDREGICVKFTSAYRQHPEKPEGGVDEVPKTKRRRGDAQRVAGHVWVTWGYDDNLKPGEPRPQTPTRPVTSLGVYFKTQADFSCAIFEPRKGKRRLPVLKGQAVRPNRLERVAEAED